MRAPHPPCLPSATEQFYRLSVLSHMSGRRRPSVGKTAAHLGPIGRKGRSRRLTDPVKAGINGNVRPTDSIGVVLVSNSGAGLHPGSITPSGVLSTPRATGNARGGLEYRDIANTNGRIGGRCCT